MYLLTPNVRQRKHTNNIHYHNNNPTSRRNYYKAQQRTRGRHDNDDGKCLQGTCVVCKRTIKCIHTTAHETHIKFVFIIIVIMGFNYHLLIKMPPCVNKIKVLIKIRSFLPWLFFFFCFAMCLLLHMSPTEQNYLNG